MSEAYRKTGRRILSGAFILLIIAAISLLILAFIFTGDTIRKGVYIEETDVSWLSVNEAYDMVTEDISRVYSENIITLSHGSRKWDVRLNDIDYEFKIDQAVQHAYSLGRTGNIFIKIRDSILFYLNGQQIEVEVSFDREKLKSILEKIKKEYDSASKNAEMTYSNGLFSFTRESVYRNLDVDRNMDLIENHLVKRDFGNIELIIEEKKPKILYDEIKVIDSVISQYSTKFDKSDINRTDNIKLACSRINNKILMPGDAFSMNDALGPRTHDNGYKEAPIIFKNELVPGTGGGVCQVSSTLYNAVLLAGLDVLEREHHSMILSYISPGRDATITEDSIDFRFVNNLKYPICLHAEVIDNRLVMSILSKKRDDGIVIKLRTETIGVYSPKPDFVILDPKLEPNQREVDRKAKKGLRVVLYRETYKDGKLQSSKKLTEDYYKPIQGKVRVGSDLYEQYIISENHK